jgi:hypothetical protein
MRKNAGGEVSVGRGKLEKRRRDARPRRKQWADAAAPRTPLRIALERVRQGCYGICAASVVAIPAAVLGEHPPPRRIIVVMVVMGASAGTAGLMAEVFENRIFPGGKHVS